MKKLVKFTLIAFYYVIIVSSCTKTDPIVPKSMNKDEALNKIRNIVGNTSNSSVFKLTNIEFDDSVIIDSSGIDVTRKKLLSLDQFKSIYHSRDTFIKITNSIENSNDIKTRSNFELDGPGKPGLHKVQYYASPISMVNGTYGINKSISSFSILNLWYETDMNGRVIGSPIIFYSGLSILQVWTQLTVTQIQFNANTLTSTFSIGGKTLYGINVYGQPIGYENPGGFNININMDSSYGSDGDIRIIGWR